MIDLHSHLDLYKDALDLIPEVSRRNIFTLVVTTSPRAWVADIKVFSGYKNIKVALGLHPEIVTKKEKERELLIKSIVKAKFIGEVGLDATGTNRSTLDLQESIFVDTVAECARQKGRIISIHSRGAVTRVLNILERYPDAGKPILHWFSGTNRELHRAIALGCWFSVSPAMLKGGKGVAVLKELPLDKVLPETDGPFTTRYSHPYMPWDAIKILGDLKRISGKSNQELNKIMINNLHVLLES